MMKYLERIAYVMVLLAAVVWLIYRPVAAWLMLAGGLGITATHLSERYGGKDVRQRRNMRLRWLLGLFYLASAWFMFRPGMDWLPCLCIAVLLELYTLFVMARRKDDE